MKKAIVYGSRFGQFYIEAIKKMKEIEVVGILARGSDRSVKCAEYYNLNLYEYLREIPENIDFACVTIGSSVFGKDGIKVAKDCLDKGINVIFEQPIHTKEISDLYKSAQLGGQRIKIGEFVL